MTATPVMAASTTVSSGHSPDWGPTLLALCRGGCSRAVQDSLHGAVLPLTAKQNLTDCQACMHHQPEPEYAQYDSVHVILEVSVNRSSLVPEAMRPYRGVPKSSDPYFAEAGIQVQ